MPEKLSVHVTFQLSAQAAMEKEMTPYSIFCENCLKGKAEYNGYSFWNELWLTKDFKLLSFCD